MRSCAGKPQAVATIVNIVVGMAHPTEGGKSHEY
jgi:hypothetical protein